jgi:hypothetical protein
MISIRLRRFLLAPLRGVLRGAFGTAGGFFG